MLVGLQNRGKTSLLSRLREVNEVESSTTTFNERVMGNEQTNTSISTSFKPLLKRFGIKEGGVYTATSNIRAYIHMYTYKSIVIRRTKRAVTVNFGMEFQDI